MSERSEEVSGRPGAGVDRASARWVGLGAVVLAALAGGGYALLRTPRTPPPKEIAGDPLLVAGRAVYLDRCVSCHGAGGRGDGPIARGLAGPPVGNLTDKTWKHGDSPGQVVGVVERGVKNTAMPGWGGTLGPDGVRAVSAYVYHLAGRAVPPELRTP